MKNTSLSAFVKLYCLLAFGGGSLAGLVMPIMYVVLKNKGFSVLEVGLLIFTSAVITAVAQIPSGILADRHGRRRVYFCGQVFFLLFAIGLVVSDSFTLMLGAMALAGLSAAMVSGTLDALFVNRINSASTDPRTIQSGIAMAGLSQMIGMLVGALISSALTQLQLEFSGLDVFEINYLLVALLLPVHLLLVYLIVPESTRQSAPSQSALADFNVALSTLRENRALQLLLLSTLLSVIAFVSFEKFWQLRLGNLVQEQGGAWIFGVAFSASMMVGAVGQGLSRRFCTLFGNDYNTTVIALRIALGVVFCLLFFLDGLIAFLVLFCSVFFVSALSASPVLTLFHSRVPDAVRSTMLAFRSVVLQLGAIIGILISAVVGENIGLRAAFLVSSVIFFGSVLVILTPTMVALGKELARSEYLQGSASPSKQ